MSATILCYHKVGPASEEGRKLNIEPSRLRSHVQFFVRRNRPFFTAGDLSGPWQPGTVCFTFDDAYQSTLVHAPQIFEEGGVRASFYAVAGRVGGASDWDGEFARPLADWDLLRETQSRGHEIGNHTRNHRRLGELPREEQLAEIQWAHNRLIEERLTPRSFCYPYGSLGPIHSAVLKEAGYGVGLALGKRIAAETDDRRALPRIVVAYSDALPMLMYKLTLKPRLSRPRKGHRQ